VTTQPSDTSAAATDAAGVSGGVIALAVAGGVGGLLLLAAGAGGIYYYTNNGPSDPSGADAHFEDAPEGDQVSEQEVSISSSDWAETHA